MPDNPEGIRNASDDLMKRIHELADQSIESK
jgi:hypothetical protein